MAMASGGSQCIFLFLLSLLFCSSCNCISAVELGANELVVEFHPSRRDLSDHFNYKTAQHDLINPPVTTYPTTPVYNPVTTPATNPVTTPGTVPPDNSGQAVVTVPATNPVAVTPNPVPTPATVPPNTPIPVPNANPVNPAVPVTNPVTTPATNPVTTPPGAAVPVTNPSPVPATNGPAAPGQSWCVARSGMQDSALQSAIDYACGMGGADCSTIQQGGTCYVPNTLQNHASVAFNSYYQKNPSQTSCDFGGTATVTNVNPSTGSCVFTTLSSSASPGTAAPSTASTPGANPISSGAPPTDPNAGNNSALGNSTTGFGDSPTSLTNSSTSASNHIPPTAGRIILLVTTIITRITVF